MAPNVKNAYPYLYMTGVFFFLECHDTSLILTWKRNKECSWKKPEKGLIKFVRKENGFIFIRGNEMFFLTREGRLASGNTPSGLPKNYVDLFIPSLPTKLNRILNQEIKLEIRKFPPTPSLVYLES